MARRIDSCMNCGETRALAAHGLCFRCYRQTERANEEAQEIDRNSPGIRIEQKRLIKAFARVMEGLADLRVSRDDILRIKKVLGPYLRLIAHLLLLEEDSSDEQ